MVKESRAPEKVWSGLGARIYTTVEDGLSSDIDYLTEASQKS